MTPNPLDNQAVRDALAAVEDAADKARAALRTLTEEAGPGGELLGADTDTLPHPAYADDKAMMAALRAMASDLATGPNTREDWERISRLARYVDMVAGYHAGYLQDDAQGAAQ